MNNQEIAFDFTNLSHTFSSHTNLSHTFSSHTRTNHIFSVFMPQMLVSRISKKLLITENAI